LYFIPEPTLGLFTLNTGTLMSWSVGFSSGFQTTISFFLAFVKFVGFLVERQSLSYKGRAG
jgi:hypothetical protein